MATEQVVLAADAKQRDASKVSAFSRFLSKYFYFCMSLLIPVVVIYGFSHTVDRDLIHATPVAPMDSLGSRSGIFRLADFLYLPVGAGADT